MSTTEAPPRRPSDHTYAATKHYLALTLLITCPILLAIPPRKFDKYTIFLGVALLGSGYQLDLERKRTGRGSYLSELNPFPTQQTHVSPTSRAAEVKEKLRAEKLERLRRDGQLGEREEEKVGALKKIWMGGEREGWKERRLREEQDAINKGKGYGSLILDQLYEVWYWKPRGENGEEEKQAEKKNKP